MIGDMMDTATVGTATTHEEPASRRSSATPQTALQQALTSAVESPERVALDVRGALPDWLTGMLVRNGPGRWDFDQSEVNHWFDGLSMLHSFDFADGGVNYCNRFVRSNAYRAVEETGKLGFSEFASDPCRTRFQRIQSMFSPNVTDNPNVSVFKFGEKFIAMSEIPLAMEFDPSTLETVGVAFENPDMFASAHPHQDVDHGAMINLSCKLGPRSSQSFFRLAPNGKPQRIAKFNRRMPTYQHSFGMTDRWLILTEFPLIVDPIDILKTGRPFIENFQYRPARGTKITAIDRETGKVGGEWEADAGFCFHHVNAYEDGEDLVVDLCRFDDASIVEELYIDRLREGGSATIGHLHRYRLTPGRKRADEKRLSDTPLELPRINYAANNGKAYRFAYGVSAADEYSLNVLAKVDVETGDALTWSEGDCAVGEPVFVASPEKRAEDDGVLLSVVLDGSSGRSFLLVLDATNLSEVARAEVSHGIPAGFHGSYVNH